MKEKKKWGYRKYLVAWEIRMQVQEKLLFKEVLRVL